jgi:divalent metal cation (Fe/Co/Zn/Cd) transporter
MTSILYTARMNTKPNLPDEIWLGKKDYSAWTDWRVNGWLFVAAIVSSVSDILFPHVVREWPTAARIIVAVIPFLALLLWVRSLMRWIRGMDELHRRITLAAVLFAVSVTFFFVVLWHRLERVGAFQAIFNTSSAASWDIGTVGHIFLLMTFCYFLGYRIFNRRYQ